MSEHELYTPGAVYKMDLSEVISDLFVLVTGSLFIIFSVLTMASFWVVTRPVKFTLWTWTKRPRKRPKITPLFLMALAAAAGWWWLV